MNDWDIKTELSVGFKLKVSPNLFSTENRDILYHGSDSRRLIVIDSKVSDIYLKKIVQYFNYHKMNYHLTIIDAVENKKSFDTLKIILGDMEQFGLLRREEPVIAIGGGVLLDIVGFASSIYRRGVPYIKVPTTLVGLIDASVGAKTAINFQSRRNRLGSYYPPIAAYLDKTFLKTLPEIEVSSGLGEILKMGIIKDKRLFELLQSCGRDLLKTKFNGSDKEDEVINRSIQGMKEELENNLWEKNLQRCVDFGHSFSPIIEMRSLEDDAVPSLTHGQAVTLDSIFSSILSYRRGRLSEREVCDIIKVSDEMKLPIHHPFFEKPDILWEALVDTMKHRNGNQYLPIPDGIGKYSFINDVTYDEVVEVAKAMGGWCK